MPNTDQKHADMCVAFHERLVEALKYEAEKLCSCLDAVDPHWHSDRCQINKYRALLVEIEKANQ